MASRTSTHVLCRGLRWRRVLAGTLAVGQNSLADVEPIPEEIEAQLDAPSGASCYLTRPCVEALGPLDERYFLFFEDLDWGIRARRAGHRVGHAHRSVVVDVGGTSIGSSRSPDAESSPLAVYLEFRNRTLVRAESLPAMAAVDRADGVAACASVVAARRFLFSVPRARGRPARRNRSPGLAGRSPQQTRDRPFPADSVERVSFLLGHARGDVPSPPCDFCDDCALSARRRQDRLTFDHEAAPAPPLRSLPTSPSCFPDAKKRVGSTIA